MIEQPNPMLRLLSNANVVLNRLILANYDLEQFDKAGQWCATAQRRFGREMRFTRCRLYLLNAKSATPNIPLAWAIADSALALSALHPIPLLFIDKPRFGMADILYPVSSPQQPTINTLGAIALYMLAFTVVTSIYRAEIGRQRWKPLHYLTYVVATLLIIHGALTDQHLDNSPVDLLDAEKAGIIAAGVVILAATIVRFRWTAKHPKFKPRH